MTITVNIVAQNVEELQEVLQKILGGNAIKTLPTKATTAPAAPVAEPVSAPAAPAAEPAKAADGPTPPAAAKEEKKATKGKKKEEAAPAAESDDVPATLEGARTMIKKINASDGANGEKGGLDKAIKIITSFGVAKVQDLPPEKFADFIAEGKKQLLIPIAPPEAPKDITKVF